MVMSIIIIIIIIIVIIIIIIMIIIIIIIDTAICSTRHTLNQPSSGRASRFPSRTAAWRWALGRGSGILSFGGRSIRGVLLLRFRGRGGKEVKR